MNTRSHLGGSWVLTIISYKSWDAVQYRRCLCPLNTGTMIPSRFSTLCYPTPRRPGIHHKTGRGRWSALSLKPSEVGTRSVFSKSLQLSCEYTSLILGACLPVPATSLDKLSRSEIDEPKGNASDAITPEAGRAAPVVGTRLDEAKQAAEANALAARYRSVLQHRGRVRSAMQLLEASEQAAAALESSMMQTDYTKGIKEGLKV